MIATLDTIETNGRSRPNRGPLTLLLDFFSSVWVGIVWLVLLFVYCSIGSAVPAIRQLPGLEMTEFEWFHWWPFDVLVALFCVSLTVVTLRKIPLKVVNLGVWTIHAGIITLCIGSYIYFGKKEEGDAPVFRRMVKIEPPGASAPSELVVLPGSETTVRVGSDVWRFEINSTNSEWALASEVDKGKKAYAVLIGVTPPPGKGPPFIRQLLAGYPQYTEDIIPSKGRAVKAIGKPLVNEELKLSLDYQPTRFFHLQDTWALFIRRVGDVDWIERPIHGMPRYHDRVASRDQVFASPTDPVAVNPIDLAVPASTPGDPLDKSDVRVTGYLRYATKQRQWIDGGPALNPVLRFTLQSQGQRDETYELAALDPMRNRAGRRTLQFRWVDDLAQLDSLPNNPWGRLSIAVPAANAKIDRELTPEAISGPDGAFTKIDGTEFSYRIRRVEEDLAIQGGQISIAMVEIETPQGRFTRMVCDQADRTKDMHGNVDDPHSGMREPREPDQRIVMTFEPRYPLYTLGASPNGLRMIAMGPGGRVLDQPVKIGGTVELSSSTKLRVESLLTNAYTEVRPFIVPLEQRQRDMREQMAMLRLEVNSGQGLQAKWLAFNPYALPGEEFAYAGRIPYQPERFQLADGSWAEVMFSRERRELPNPVAMEEFELQTHFGGYTGSTSTIFNYVSRLRFLDNGQWTDPKPIAVNAPTEYGGYWYFQSMWDRPQPDDPTGGMNYTGLGIGNRHGVYVQLAGCCIATAGMCYAFYVKPMIKRRRAEQARGQSAQSETMTADEAIESPMRASISV